MHPTSLAVTPAAFAHPAPALTLAGDTRSVRRRTGKRSLVLQTKRAIVAVSVALTLAGCAHVRPIDPTASVSELHDVNRSLAGREALVRLTDGTEMMAHDVTVSHESVSLVLEHFRSALTERPGRTTREIPLAEVASITVTCRGRGALDGLLIGLFGGAAGGVLFGAAAYTEGDRYLHSRSDAAMFSGVVYGFLGGVSGVLYGAGNGSTHVYEFVVSRADTAQGQVPN